uniref:Gastrokine-1 n=1 Tax=Anolis carolinensis TaxID=28377 RepID=A0A803TLX5_ANOCA
MQRLDGHLSGVGGWCFSIQVWCLWGGLDVLWRAPCGSGRPGPCFLAEWGWTRWPLWSLPTLRFYDSMTLTCSAFSPKNISERNQGNVGGRAHQSVSIDNQKQVVNVDNNNGWNSWNTVWDYKNGYVATRVLSKKSCILSRMNPEVMPDVTTLPDAIRIKQKDRTKGPAHKEVTYVVSSKRITDLAPYGKNIQALCRGIPTFPAYESPPPLVPFFWGGGAIAHVHPPF